MRNPGCWKETIWKLDKSGSAVLILHKLVVSDFKILSLASYFMVVMTSHFLIIII